MSTLQKHREWRFKYIHISLVQVGIKYLTKEGLNTFILVVLRDVSSQIFKAHY